MKRQEAQPNNMSIHGPIVTTGEQNEKKRWQRRNQGQGVQVAQVAQVQGVRGTGDQMQPNGVSFHFQYIYELTRLFGINPNAFLDFCFAAVIILFFLIFLFLTGVEDFLIKKTR